MTLCVRAFRCRSIFNSFFLGGFECSLQRNVADDGVRLDLIASTEHDTSAPPRTMR